MKPAQATSPKASDTARNWQALIALSLLYLYSYVLLEWLFFITKQSFMSALAPRETLGVLLTSPLPAVLVLVAFYALIAGAQSLGGNTRYRAAWSTIAHLPPAFILASILLLLIDNFTYTFFKFGIVATRGYLRIGYGALFLALVTGALRHCRKVVVLHGGLPVPLQRPGKTATALVLLSLIGVALRFQEGDKTIGDVTGNTKGKQPNILFVSIDGLNAINMSLYGYTRDTTPFMRQFAGDALVCENNFSNAGASGASFASMMTGRLPTENHLVYPPDILRGRYSYQHLPGILRRLGYHSLDMSERYYVDPYDLNMLDSFDRANMRSAGTSKIYARLSNWIGLDSSYFLTVMLERIGGRLEHAFGGRLMSNTYVEVTESHLFRKDQERVDESVEFMNASREPFFVHLHLMVTHGPNFNPRFDSFSQREPQKVFWMRDYYDDSILDSDDHVRQLIEALQQNGRLDKTIVILNSDHGQGYEPRQRIPMMIRFPGGQHAARIRANTQNVDIGATILDYLGIDQPKWLGGRSLISRIDPHRIIMFVAVKASGIVEDAERRGIFRMDLSLIGPPFYALGALNAIVCNRFYSLDLAKGLLLHGEIPEHTEPCASADLPSTDTIEQALVNHLAANHWDVSSLKLPLPRQAMRPLTLDPN